MAKFIKLNTTNGNLEEGTGLVSSSGVPDANKLVETDGSGRIDQSMMPVGIGADTKSIIASETLTSGNFVNVWNDAGTIKIRKADASTSGKSANGFVLSAVTTGQFGLVYFEGVNTSLSGLTLGDVFFLSTTPGTPSSVPPSTGGNIVQKLGVALSPTEISFEPSQPITLA